MATEEEYRRRNNAAKWRGILTLLLVISPFIVGLQFTIVIAVIWLAVMLLSWPPETSGMSNEECAKYYGYDKEDKS